ncbi:MAG: universal stress protein [Pirellulaceae bacterium]
MKLRRILVPIDFSPGSEAALEMATSIARDSGGTLILAHVEVIPLSAGGGEYLYALPEPPTEELLARLNAVVLPDANIPVERRLLAGDPADAIIRLAQTEDVDMIVMGTHGRRGLTRLLMGSVAEVVVRAAPCPVLTVKQPAHAVAQK